LKDLNFGKIESLIYLKAGSSFFVDTLNVSGAWLPRFARAEGRAQAVGDQTMVATWGAPDLQARPTHIWGSGRRASIHRQSSSRCRYGPL
jgi:hypothetical protein